MSKIFWTVGILVIVFATPIFGKFVSGITGVVQGFNTYVVPFVPGELFFVIAMLGFGLMYRVYLSLKNT